MHVRTGLGVALLVALVVSSCSSSTTDTSSLTTDTRTLDEQNTEELESLLSSGKADDVLVAVAPESWDALGVPSGDLAIERDVRFDPATAVEVGEGLLLMQGTVDGVATTFVVRFDANGKLQLVATSAEPTFANDTAPSTTVALEPTIAPTTDASALAMNASTELSLELSRTSNGGVDCTNGGALCSVVLRWLDNSAAEDAYVAVIESDYTGTTFDVPGAAIPGVANMAESTPQLAAVGFRFCITLYAVKDGARSAPSERLCATISAAHQIELVS